MIGPEYSPLIGPDDEYCGRVSSDWSRILTSALIGSQGGGGEAAGAGQRGEAPQDGAQAEVQGEELHILK